MEAAANRLTAFPVGRGYFSHNWRTAQTREPQGKRMVAIFRAFGSFNWLGLREARRIYFGHRLLNNPFIARKIKSAVPSM